MCIYKGWYILVHWYPYGEKKVVKVNKKTNNGVLMFCCRIVPSIKPRMTLLSVLFTRETSICQGVAAAASDGSSLLTAPSAVAPCLLTQYCASEILGKTTTDPGS